MYRIVEYKNRFEIEKLIIENDFFWFLDLIPIYTIKKEVWYKLTKPSIGLRCVPITFKNKEECLEYISDLSKYPIYHKAV